MEEEVESREVCSWIISKTNIMDKWKKINPEFTDFLKEKWEIQNFNYKQAEKLIEIGLKPEEVYFAKWLRDEKGRDFDTISPEETNDLREEYQRKLVSVLVKEVKEEINEIEREIQALKESLDNDQAELVERFINANKKIIKDEEDDQARSELKELSKVLEEKDFSEENIEEIIRYCERLVDLEWQEEFINGELQKGTQTVIQISPK